MFRRFSTTAVKYSSNLEEKQYLRVISNILDNGEFQKGRNGNVYSSIGESMRFSLKNNTIPLLTTKKVAWKTCLKELLWFIKGDTNNKLLKNDNVSIWNGNGTREFLDSRGLYHLKEDDLGPVYGHQWRYWNASYSKNLGCLENYDGKGIDQLQNVIDLLNHPTDKYSRRIIMSSWNPEQLNEMALPPCHVLSQFKVTNDNELSCILYQRSGDMGLGIPFNIASYSLLTHLLAKHCNLKAKEFIHFIGDAHIYDDHCNILKQQVNRESYPFPQLIIENKYDNINNYEVEDFIVENYYYCDALKMNMRV
jgi:thymidylate synthase|tara:strand:+ start:1554 stop:2477 length:924 start_codon:yes stop_codon:yes gene_type:complete